MKEKKSIWLQTVKQMNIGVGVCGVGALLYLALSAMDLLVVADILVVVFGAISLYVFFSVVDGRQKNKEAVTYNLLWGATALAVMLCGCAVLTLKLRLGL